MAKLLNTIPKPCGLVKAFKLTLVVVLLLFSIARPVWFANAQVVLPPDAQPTCVVTAPVFASWFESGSVSLNGVVKPANSITFPDTPNCSFYQWSEQMFLWLTSPTPPSYGGGGGRIFDSPVFFDVSPLDASGNRTFIPHTQGRFRDLGLETARVGPHGLPMIRDISGRVFEIEHPSLAPSGKQLILDGSGRSVEIGSIRLGGDRRPIFLDIAGRTIQNPKPIIRPELPQGRILQRFLSGKILIFLDAFGNAIDTDPGQADGAVLLAQNGSLIYYTTTVNDVYAFFLTGAKNGGITPEPTQFPTTQAELDKVIAFAATKSKTFPDPEALAIVIKTAWVEAAGLPNLSSYITIQATIPVYNTANPNLWTPIPSQKKTVQMALLGMHVVGSTKGHPEMIWATFEHFSNTPNATYTYNSTSGSNPKMVAQDTTGTWLFCASGSAGPFNVTHMQTSPFGSATIASIAPFTISPSDTIRLKPFGGASNASPNPLHATVAASNTEIIAINNSVLGQLVSGDIRRNYYMTGSTWTIGGASPLGSFGNPGNNTLAPGTEVGTSQLASSVMETYQQANSLFNKDSDNCFTCHVTNTTAVSHVFAPLKPLFP